MSVSDTSTEKKFFLLLISLITIPIIYHLGKNTGSIIANIYFWLTY